MTDTFAYDVFISYSSKDSAWVRGELLRQVEAAGLRACIDFRDFEPGAPSVSEMERAVLTSRKTLLVLTQNYLNSDWTTFESVMLQTLDPINRQRRLIPLLKDKCQLPLRIGYLTYVNFVDPEDPAFAWSRLLTALGANAASLATPPSRPQPAATPVHSNPQPASSASNLADLRKRLIDRCSVSDLKDLCFVLGIDPENYSSAKNDMVRELLTDLNRWGRLDEFVQTVRAEKPGVLS